MLLLSVKLSLLVVGWTLAWYCSQNHWSSLL